MNSEKLTPDYDYSGMVAATWDLSRGDTSTWDDRMFYLDLVREYGQPVLDVGCGTGRLVLDYCTQGIDIDGVDNSPEMLAICRDKARKLGLSPALFQQDIVELDLPRTYQTILVPSSTFQLITGDGAAEEVLRRFFRHLKPGGALIMPFSFEWKAGEALDTGWYQRFNLVRPEDGARVRCMEHTWFEPDEQLWHTEQRFEVELEGEVIAREEHRTSPEGRWYSQAQARQLVAEAGFGDIQLFQGFTRQPAEENDRLFCVLGIKP